MSKILIVDDEEDIRAEISEYLQLKGYSTCEAHDGIEAQVVYGIEHPSMLLTDLKMPRCDGHELICKIRELDTQLPIIVMTGHYLPEELEKVRSVGATETMKKPINVKELLNSVKQHLS